MKKIMLSLGGIAALLAIGITACQSNQAKEVTNVTPKLSKEELVKKGEYLVNTIGCDDCHSPKIMGPKGPEVDLEHRFAGFLQDHPTPPADSNALKKGWALFGPELTVAVGPWGTSYAANITSDSTGIGNWTEAQFFKAIREGKYKGLDNSRPLLPPMPWYNFAKLTDEDISAIFNYLKSTKPVKNVVPSPILASHM
ncbi:c-type cytochrome [Flavihumibacter profundi]|uniref:c-type cytochrome n=1 Tax=Flavihumibacter profundi TaxID=2716883 RepID=UPI001CC747DB|nr:c-type cytochrome [Flavihumibacter profundi]MBZ5855987.1 c-type cytochrome [Flavihumibacter profundi]